MAVNGQNVHSGSQLSRSTQKESVFTGKSTYTRETILIATGHSLSAGSLFDRGG
jgi:hypothetical protein